MICYIEMCKKIIVAKGLCGMHYNRLIKGKDLYAPGRYKLDENGIRAKIIHNKRKSPEESFWERVVKTEECWNWSGAKYSNNYGIFKRISLDEKLVHRIAWTMASKESIPERSCNSSYMR